MPINFQFRRGTTAELSTQTGLVGELFVDTTKDTVVVMDGVTAGGSPLVTEASLAATEASLTAAIANVSGGSAGGESNVYTSVSALKTQSPLAGTIVKTSGYYSPADGGEASYLVMTPAQYSKTADGFGDHVLANGNIAVLVVQDRIQALQYGLVNDGVTDNQAALKALAETGMPVRFPANGAFKLIYAPNMTAEFTASVDFNNSRLICDGVNPPVDQNNDGIPDLDPQYQTPEYAEFNYLLYYGSHAFVKLSSPGEWTDHGAGSALLTLVQSVPTITGKYIQSLLDQPDYANMAMIFETETPAYVYRTSEINRTEMVVHTRHGQLTNPLEKDLETAQITNIKTLPLSPRTTVYENMILDLTEAPTNMDDGYLTTYVQIVDGSHIKVKNFHISQHAETRYSQFKGPVFFNLTRTALCEIDGLVAPWANQNTAPAGDPREGQSHYTYVLTYGVNVDTMIKNILSAGDGYGAFGGFANWNTTFDNCVTNRIDFHEPQYGTTYVRNCTIGSHGIKTFNIGDLIIENCKFTDHGGWVGGTRFISSRPDHGGWCDGNLIVRNCEFFNTIGYRRYLQEGDGLNANSTYLSYHPETSAFEPYNWRSQTYENCTVHNGEVVIGQFAAATDWIIQSNEIKATGLKVANGGKWVVQSNELPWEMYNAQFNTAYTDAPHFLWSFDSASYWKKYDPDRVIYGPNAVRKYSVDITNMTDIITGDPIEPRYYNAPVNRRITLRDSVIDEVYFWPEATDVNVNVIIDNCKSHEAHGAMVIYPQLQGMYTITNCEINNVKLGNAAEQQWPVKIDLRNNTFKTGGEPHLLRQGRSVDGIINRWHGRGDYVTIENNTFNITQDAANSWTWYIQEILKGNASGNWISFNGAAPVNTYRHGSWGDGTSGIVPSGFNHDNTVMMAYTYRDGYEEPWGNYPPNDYQELNFKMPAYEGQKSYVAIDSSEGVTITRSATGFDVTMTDYTMNGGIRYKF